MDAYLIAWLEALFSRSRISPYDVARFWVVGMGFSQIPPETKFVIHQVVWSVVLPMLVLLVLRFLWWQIRLAERQNANGLYNDLKLESVARYWTLAVLCLTPILVPWGPDQWFSVAYFTFMLASQYFSALNWTPPPKRALKSSRAAVWRAGSHRVARCRGNRVVAAGGLPVRFYRADALTPRLSDG